jgi:hypothetical protein
MNSYKRLIILMVYFISIPLQNVLAMTESQKTSLAKEVVEKFCSSEFMGIQDIRLDLAKYSSKQQEQEKKRDPEFKGMVKYWDNDPLYVVSSYQIINVLVKKNHAEATIAYKLLARTEDDGVFKRKLIPIDVADDIVNLRLIYDGSKWWILDPPIPRISLEAITEYHRNNINIMGNDWLKRSNISEDQKRYYRRLQENLKIFNALR